MKRIQRGIAITMAVSLLMTSMMITSVMATGNQDLGIKIAKADKSQTKVIESVRDNEKKNDKVVKVAKDNLETEKKAIESQKDELEAQKEGLEEQYEEAKESGDLVKAEEINAQIQKIKTDIETFKQQVKQKKEEIKAAIKSNYTSEELAKLKLVSDKIKKNNKNVTVLPVENIIVKGVNVKFDTPPVIKSGRTLIPVKALTEAFGADVKWIGAEKKVIITKGDVQIVLTLDSNKIYVNGVEAKIDVPACSINGRTVVPLKFIVEQLGLTVNWHKDTKDIEIEQPTTTPPATTGSAIVVAD